MGILTTTIVTALSVVGAMNGNIIEKEPYSFYDPLGYTEYNILNDDTSFSYNNNVRSIINSSKYMNRSNVTVLTHGMGADASYWLVEQEDEFGNLINNRYVQSTSSLPFILCNSDNRTGDVGLELDLKHNYIYKFGYDTLDCEFVKLWKLTLSNNNTIDDLTDDYYSFIEVNNIDFNAVNAQIVLLYEGNMGYSNVTVTNNQAYQYFELALNTVLSAIAINQYGYLPSLNLIGHSRGGIINLLYANYYSEIVNNSISLGTPFLGSKWAELMVDANKLIEGNENYTAYDDMLDSNHFNEYSGMLNDINDVVNFYSIGFGQTYQYFVNTITTMCINNPNFTNNMVQLFSDLTGNILDNSTITTIVDNFIDGLQELTEYIIDILDSIIDTLDINTLINDIIEDVENENLLIIKDFISNFINILVEDILIIEGEIDYIESDIAVNLDSQLGYQRGTTNPIYNFDSRDTIILGNSNNNHYYDVSHCADSSLPWIAHNFETKNPTANDLIIDYLNLNNGFHEHSYLSFSTDETHYQYCICGIYKLEEENHSFEYDYLNEATHRHYCSHEECNYFNDYPHQFEYDYIDDTIHEKECVDCQYLVEESHLLNIYIGTNYSGHTVYCACGLAGSSYEHVLNKFSGKCSFCGFPMADPQPPVVPPIIINPII